MSKQVYKQVYCSLLPFMMMPCVASGIFSGFSNDVKHTPIVKIAHQIGYTSIGVITGFLYPVSFPLLAGYVVYKNC